VTAGITTARNRGIWRVGLWPVATVGPAPDDSSRWQDQGFTGPEL